MRRQWFLICLFSLLLVSSGLAAYRFYSPYGYGSGGFSSLSIFFDDFLSFLEENEFLIDALVFLVVFLMVSKKVFYKSFSEDKILYIVVGVALTIGIMIYERRVLDYSLIINSGWWAMVVLAGFVLYALTSFGSRGMRLIALGTLGFVATSWAMVQFSDYLFRAGIPEFIFPLIALAFVGMLVYGIILMAKGEREDNGGSSHSRS